MKNRVIVPCQGLKRGQNGKDPGLDISGNLRAPCGDGNVLYLDYINVNVLVIVCHNCARCYHCLKHNGISVLLLTTAYEFAVISLPKNRG